MFHGKYRDEASSICFMETELRRGHPVRLAGCLRLLLRRSSCTCTPRRFLCQTQVQLISQCLLILRRTITFSVCPHPHCIDGSMDYHGRAGYEECAIYLFRLQRSTSFPLRIKIGPNFRLFVGRRGPGTSSPLSRTRLIFSRVAASRW